MGLMQRAYETYEQMAPRYAGVYEAGQKEVLAPVGHITTKAKLVITIDENGHFVGAREAEDDEEKVIIPVTEDSASRSGTTISPHPLCEQIEYISGKDEKKRNKYIELLSRWVQYDPEQATTKAVLQYIKGGTLVKDLTSAGLLTIDEGGIKQKKSLVRWIVLGEKVPDCTRNTELMHSYSRFYEEEVSKRKEDLCYLRGEKQPVATKHASGVVSFYGRAKLISANDSRGFTYRGRFGTSEDALTVGYDSSQKAHNALKWLVANQGVTYGGRTFLCWNPKGQELPQIQSSLLFEADPIVQFSDYKEELNKALSGWQENLTKDASAVIVSLDAATTGRLAVTYYNELQASDFLLRLRDWDENCCWYYSRFGIQSPALFNIINYAFGNRRDDGHIETDDRIVRQQMQRMIFCRIERAPMPVDIARALVERCGQLGLYDRSLREKLLFTACAVIKKYEWDRKKEEWKLALEPDKKDRSYQFGRLLAVLEKAERDTYGTEEGREPNAIRMQPVFTRRPQDTAAVVIEQLKKAYYPRLRTGSRVYYDKLIGDIMNVISETDEPVNAPLRPAYLMGYYLQKRELYQSRKNDNEEKEEEE